MLGEIKVSLPHKYSCRVYQRPLFQAMNVEKKRKAILVWHRRAGKDKSVVNFTAEKTQERVGAYYYIFPKYRQGRKVLWEGIDKDGVKFIDHFPKALRRGQPNNTEMKIEFLNGSLFRVIGGDNIDSVVGTNPVGCVFSEYSLHDPRTWDYMRPILAENGGWAVFVFTPCGENHAYQLLEMAQNDPEWFCQVLTVDDTGAIMPEVLAQERKEIIAKDGNDALYQQEYYCSFKVPMPGSYYAQQIMKVYDDKRVCNVPYEAIIPVDTWWDLGMDDSTTIWFSQTVGKELRLIDYEEYNGEGLAFYAKLLKEKPYVYGNHNMPHDIDVRELGTGITRKATAESLGIRPIVTVKRSGLDTGIEACRNIFPRCWFDEKKCARGLNALKSYHKVYDEKNKCFKNHPEHDWSSHGADGFRTLGVGYKGMIVASGPAAPFKPKYKY
jgi:phage terminase large subunit